MWGLSGLTYLCSYLGLKGGWDCQRRGQIPQYHRLERSWETLIQEQGEQPNFKDVYKNHHNSLFTGFKSCTTFLVSPCSTVPSGAHLLTQVFINRTCDSSARLRTKGATCHGSLSEPVTLTHKRLGSHARRWFHVSLTLWVHILVFLFRTQ